VTTDVIAKINKHTTERKYDWLEKHLDFWPYAEVR
jgi:hypothetical protein